MLFKKKIFNCSKVFVNKWLNWKLVHLNKFNIDVSNKARHIVDSMNHFALCTEDDKNGKIYKIITNNGNKKWVVYDKSLKIKGYIYNVGIYDKNSNITYSEKDIESLDETSTKELILEFSNSYNRDLNSNNLVIHSLISKEEEDDEETDENFEN